MFFLTVLRFRVTQIDCLVTFNRPVGLRKGYWGAASTTIRSNEKVHIVYIISYNQNVLFCDFVCSSQKKTIIMIGTKC